MLYYHRGTIEFVSEKLKNNKEFIIKAVEINIRNLEFASENLKNDKEIVLNAVSLCGFALKFEK
jgi:hypothetical protein